MGWYLFIASIFAVPLTIAFIYTEWASHHYNPSYLSEDAVIIWFTVGCFLSLFWPAVFTVLPAIFVLKYSLMYYEKLRKYK